MSYSIKDLKALIASIKDVDLPEDQIVIEKSEHYSVTGSYAHGMTPHYKGIDSFAKLSTIVNLGYRASKSDTSVTEPLHTKLMNHYNQFSIPDSTIHQNRNGAGAQTMNYELWYSDAASDLRTRSVVRKLTNDPVEFSEVHKDHGTVTYRIIASLSRYDYKVGCVFCEPSTSARYNYIDKGMYLFSYIPKDTGNVHHFFAKELDGAAWRVLFLLAHLPAAANAVLQDSCFLNAKTANIVVMGLTKRLGMLDPKQLTQGTDRTYLTFDNEIKKHWLASAENRLFAEFKKGERASVVKSGVLLTKDSAAYEKLSFGYPNLVKTLEELGQYTFSFEREFDIYKIGNVMVNKFLIHVSPANPITFTVNGMTINLGQTASFRYQINQYSVNKEEVAELVNQAFCFTDVAEYNKLLDRVSHMSLLVHNAWSQGMSLRWRKLPDKLNDRGHSFFERDKLDKWKNNPRLRFKKDGNKYYLYTGENDENKVLIPYFVGFVRGVHNINKATNWCNIYSPDSYEASEKRLIDLLVEKTKSKTRSVKNEDGTTTETGGVATMTADEAKAVLYAADTVTAKAIAKSKQFLDGVVAAVGAEEATLGNMTGYKVKGAKHTYFVETATNRAHSFETGQYICIVDSNHGVRLGYDELATRLMVLKNDARTVGKISTLSQYVK